MCHFSRDARNGTSTAMPHHGDSEQRLVMVSSAPGQIQKVYRMDPSPRWALLRPPRHAQELQNGRFKSLLLMGHAQGSVGGEVCWRNALTDGSDHSEQESYCNSHQWP